MSGVNDIIFSGGVMKNKKFSFVRWLTKKDIEKLVKLLDYEIIPNRDDLKYKSIRRSKDKEGHYHIYIECKDLIAIETKERFTKFLSNSETFKNAMRRGGLFAAVLASALGDYPSYSVYDDDIITLDITDFKINELSYKSQDKVSENNERMTKQYNKYMVEKFGRFYNGMKAAALKKSYKEDREKTQNQETEQTKENNEETMEK